MSAPTWTPGPWEIHHRHGVSDQFDIMPVASRGCGWVTLPDDDPAGVGEYMQVGGLCTIATARLIAAAPDLVGALKGLYDAVDSCCELTPKVLERARVALTKAGAA